jgi:hypothetical protein
MLYNDSKLLLIPKLFNLLYLRLIKEILVIVLKVEIVEIELIDIINKLL